jgi:hypothetical protein
MAPLPKRKAKTAPAAVLQRPRRAGVGKLLLDPLREKPWDTLGRLGALIAALGTVVTGLGFVTLRAREALLGLSTSLSYPKQEWLVVGFDVVGALLSRGLAVLVSDHYVLKVSGLALLLLVLLDFMLITRPSRLALSLGILALSTVLLVGGSGFYQIALTANSLTDAGPSQGLGCGERLSANLADRAAFETCSWLVNDSLRNSRLCKDLGGILGWLLAACILGAVAGARTSVPNQSLSRLRWLLVGAHVLVGLLLLYNLPRAYAFGTWGLRYPQVWIQEKCDAALSQVTAVGNCWAFDVSAGAEQKVIFLRGSHCPEGRDGSFVYLGTADTKGSECLIPLSSPPRVITNGPNP